MCRTHLVPIRLHPCLGAVAACCPPAVTCYHNTTGLATCVNILKAVTLMTVGAASVLARLRAMRGDSRFTAALAASEGGRWCKGAGLDVAATVQLLHSHLVSLSSEAWLPATDLQCIEELLSGSPSLVSHWGGAS